MQKFIEDIERQNIGRIEKNAHLSKYTTYQVGGIARVIVFPKNMYIQKKI